MNSASEGLTNKPDNGESLPEIQRERQESLVHARSGTWVVRGGELKQGPREKNLRSVFKAYKLWGICVAAMPGKTSEEIAAFGTFGNLQMLVALSNELKKDANVLVVCEPGRNWPNALLLFQQEPTLYDWELVVSVFMRRGQHPNPSYKGPRNVI